MEKAIRSIAWTNPDADAATDVTDAIEDGVVSATPHPDDAIDRPKGYTVRLTLTPDSEAFADELQEALLSLDPPTVTVRLEGVDAPIENVPVGVSKVPHLGEQNEAELSVKPDGHDQFHPHF
jgi:hypothetical protein